VFVEITTTAAATPSSSSSSKKTGLMATLHHTFPTCTGGVVQAKGLKPGMCLHTERGGEAIVNRAKLRTAKKNDVTNSIELKDADLVAVGGVVTHSRKHSPPLSHAA